MVVEGVHNSCCSRGGVVRMSVLVHWMSSRPAHTVRCSFVSPTRAVDANDSNRSRHAHARDRVRIHARVAIGERARDAKEEHDENRRVRATRMDGRRSNARHENDGEGDGARSMDETDAWHSSFSADARMQSDLFDLGVRTTSPQLDCWCDRRHARVDWRCRWKIGYHYRWCCQPNTPHAKVESCVASIAPFEERWHNHCRVMTRKMILVVARISIHYPRRHQRQRRLANGGTRSR